MFVRELEPLATFLRKLNANNNWGPNHKQTRAQTSREVYANDPTQDYYTTRAADNETWQRLQEPEVGLRAEVGKRCDEFLNWEQTRRVRDKLSSSSSSSVVVVLEFSGSEQKRTGAKTATRKTTLLKRTTNKSSPNSVSSVDNVNAESRVMLRQWIRICRKWSKHSPATKRRS